MAKCSTRDNKIDAIARGTEILYQLMEQAHTRINKANKKTSQLEEWIARSPQAIKMIKDLDAAIAMFTPTNQIVDYEISSYATGNKRWRRAPFQHPVSIQDLLLQDIRTCQEKNKLLGEKIEKIVLQNQMLADQASSIYQTPSERLKKSPIMNNPREGNKF